VPLGASGVFVRALFTDRVITPVAAVAGDTVPVAIGTTNCSSATAGTTNHASGRPTRPNAVALESD
jgi:hypothetical protein